MQSLPPLPSSLSTRLLSTINPQTGACKHHPAVQLCELVDHNSRWIVRRKICSKCGARAPVGVSRRMPGVSVVNPANNRNNVGPSGRRQQPEPSRRRSAEQGDEVVQDINAISSSSRYDTSLSKSRASTSEMNGRGVGKLERRGAGSKEVTDLTKSYSSRGAPATEKSYRERGNMDSSDRTGYVDKRRSSRSKSARRTRSLSQPRKDSGGGNNDVRGEHLPMGHGRRSSSRNSKELRSRVTWSTKPESLSSSELSNVDGRIKDEVAVLQQQQQLAVIPKKKKREHSKKERKYHQNHDENNIVSVYSKPVVHIDRMDRVIQSFSQVCT